MAQDYLINTRTYAVTTDKLGVDPLLDKVIPSILNITTFSYYTVRQHERGNPALIAYRVYQNVNLWWILIAYNKLPSFKSVIEGVTLQVPSITEVTRILSDNATNANSDIRVVTI